MIDVLVIDDDKGVRQLIRDTLEESGYCVDEAVDGRSALESIYKKKPRLVVCDVRMPHLNGYELFQSLRKSGSDLSGMPFIFLSGLSDKQYVKAGYKIGADDYITKPVDIDVLSMKIAAMLRKASKPTPKEVVWQTPNKGPNANSGSNGNEDRTDHDHKDQSDRGSTFESRLTKAVASGNDLASAGFQFVGLNEFKQVLGDRWPKVKSKALTLCENVIRSEMGLDDVFTRFGDTGYLVLFEGMDQQAADSRAKSIANRIRKCLVGEQGGIFNDLNVHTDVLNPRQFLDENGTITGRGLGDVFQGRADEKNTPSSGGRPTWFLDQLQSVYRPLWSAKRQMIIGSQCLPTRTTSYANLRGPACLHGGPDDELAIYLDCFMVEQVAKALRDAMKDNILAPVTVPIHFRSLLSENLETLSASFEQMPETLRMRQLMLEVVGIPECRDKETVYRVFQAASRFSKHITADFSPSDRHASVLKGKGANVLRLELDGIDEISPGSKLAEDVKRFGQDAVAGGFHPRLDSVTSIQAFNFGCSNGYELINGRIIGPEAGAPIQPSALPKSKILVM